MAPGGVRKMKQRFISPNKLQQSLVNRSSKHNVTVSVITRNGIMGRGNAATDKGNSNIENDASPNGSYGGNNNGTTSQTLGSANMEVPSSQTPEVPSSQTPEVPSTQSTEVPLTESSEIPLTETSHETGYYSLYYILILIIVCMKNIIL